MLNTFELGPFLNVAAPAFMVRDHESRKHILDDLMGKNGLLLGFIGDIWLPASVRRILWLQRFNMTQVSGLVMLDGQQIVRHKWLVPDERVWPHINELLQAAQSLNA
jgi:hypothetical protein